MKKSKTQNRLKVTQTCVRCTDLTVTALKNLKDSLKKPIKFV